MNPHSLCLFWFPHIFILMMSILRISLLPYGWFSWCLDNPFLHSSCYGFVGEKSLFYFLKINLLCIHFRKTGLPHFIWAQITFSTLKLTFHCLLFSIVLGGILSFYSIITHVNTMHSFSSNPLRFLLVTSFENIYQKVSVYIHFFTILLTKPMALCIWRLKSFISFQKNLATNFPNTVSSPFSFSFPFKTRRTYSLHLDSFNIVLVFPLFLYSSVWIISIDLLLSPLTFSSARPNI